MIPLPAVLAITIEVGGKERDRDKEDKPGSIKWCSSHAQCPSINPNVRPRLATNNLLSRPFLLDWFLNREGGLQSE